MEAQIPGEVGYRWTTVTADDKSGVIYIVTFLSFTYTVLTLLARVYIKRRILGLDDGAVFLAKIVALVQFGLLLASLKAGLGQSFGLLDYDRYQTMTAYLYGNQIALYLALGVSKLATILLVRRLFTSEMREAWLTIHSCGGVVVIWTVLAAILVSAGCSPASTFPRIASQACHTLQARYTVVVLTDAITDVGLIFVPAFLCRNLQVSMKMKVQIFIVFAFRLPLIVLAALSLRSWTASLTAPNPGVARYPAIVYQQCQIGGSLIAATIPCLMSWLRSFDTGSGVKANIDTSVNGGSRLRSNSQFPGSYQMASLKRNESSNLDETQFDPELSERLQSRTFASMSSYPSRTYTTSDACDIADANDTWDERGPRNSHGSESVLVVSNTIP